MVCPEALVACRRKPDQGKAQDTAPHFSPTGTVEVKKAAWFASVRKIKCWIHDGFVYFPRFRGNVEFL